MTERDSFTLPMPNDDLRKFLSELTTLCCKHKLGILDGILFMMEPEDFAFEYTADDDSVLHLGGHP